MLLSHTVLPELLLQQVEPDAAPAAAVPEDAPNPPVVDVVPEVVERPLTPRQAAFVQEYLIDNNGARAAIRAGYSVNGAEVVASNLLTVAKVAAAVAKAQAQRASRINVTADSVLHEMSLLANSSIHHYTVDDFGNLKATPDAPEGAIRAVQSVKKTIKIDKDDNITYVVEFKLWDKPGTLKLMGRHIGLFADKIEVTGPGGGPLEHIVKVERVVIDSPQTTDMPQLPVITVDVIRPEES